MARETKIGFLLVIVLLGAFGYVVYRKLNENPDLASLASAEADGDAPRTDEGDVEKPIDSDKVTSDETEADPFGDQVEPVEEQRPATRTAAHRRHQHLPVEIPDLEDASESLERTQTDELGLERTPPREIAEEIAEAEPADEEMAQLASNDVDPSAGGAELVPSLEEGEAEPETPSLTPGLESAPPSQVPARLEEEDDEQRLGGFEVTQENSPPVTLQIPEAEPAAEITTEREEEDPLDRRLGGYVAEEVTANRAVSRTRVTRSAVPVPTQLPEYQHNEHSPEHHRGARLNGIDLAAADTPSIDEPLKSDAPTPVMPRHGGESTVIKRRNAAAPPTISSHEFGHDAKHDGRHDGRIAAAEPEAPAHRPAPPSHHAVPVPVPVPDQVPHGNDHTARPDHTLHHAGDPRHEMYTVKPNDNFWSISKQQYGTARLFMALTRYNHNRVSDPGQLRPGMQVATPPREVLERQFPDLIDKSGREPRSNGATDVQHAEHKSPTGYFVGPAGEPLYRVGATDTLTGISQRHLGRSSRWPEIYDRNRDVLKRPDALQIGTVIRLPPDASRLSLVPDASERR